jgi:hypothetical protein
MKTLLTFLLPFLASTLVTGLVPVKRREAPPPVVVPSEVPLPVTPAYPSVLSSLSTAITPAKDEGDGAIDDSHRPGNKIRPTNPDAANRVPGIYANGQIKGYDQPSPKPNHYKSDPHRHGKKLKPANPDVANRVHGHYLDGQTKVFNHPAKETSVSHEVQKRASEINEADEAEDIENSPVTNGDMAENDDKAPPPPPSTQETGVPAPLTEKNVMEDMSNNSESQSYSYGKSDSKKKEKSEKKAAKKQYKTDKKEAKKQLKLEKKKHKYEQKGDKSAQKYNYKMTSIHSDEGASMYSYAHYG